MNFRRITLGIFGTLSLTGTSYLLYDNYNNKNQIYEMKNDLKDIREDIHNIRNSITYNNITKSQINSRDTYDEKITSENSYIKKTIADKLSYISGLSKTNEMYIKYSRWIKSVVKLPQKIKKVDYRDKKELAIKIKNHLDKNIYGMEETKIQIISAVLSYIENPKSNNNLALVGPPGIGKTTILKSISESVDLAFKQISVGNCTDTLWLKGSAFAYHSSEPGIIAKSIIDIGYKNGIILFDEVDKLSQTNHGIQVMNSLFHITDQTQNENFNDDYFEDVPIDLSNYLFVFSLNDEDVLPAPMKSRLNIIKVDDYTSEDKVHIVKKYLLPKLYQKLDIKSSNIQFSDDYIRKLVNQNKDIRKINQILQNNIQVINYKNIIGEYRYPYTVKSESKI